MKKEKKSGGYFLELLPSEIQAKIVVNLSKLHPNDVAEQIVRLKAEEFLNLADFIATLFNWDDSYEGRDFWEEVIDNKYDGKDLEEAMGELFDTKVMSISDALSKKLNEMLTDLFGNETKKFIDKHDQISKNPSMYKTGFQYAKELTDDEFEKFVDNIESIGRSSEDYLSDRYYSFNDFLASAFPFFSTKEGAMYWAEIRNRDIPETLDDVLAELNIPKSDDNEEI